MSSDDIGELLAGFEPLPACLFSPSAAAAASNERAEPSASNPPPVDSSVGALALATEPTHGSKGERDRKARYRDRSRNELNYLREVSAELELELERWRRRVDGRSSTGHEGITMSTQAKVWKALAGRQRAAWQAAAAENARLRVLLENQLKFAAQLEFLTQQRSAVPRSLSGMQRATIDAMDAAIFDAYIAELDVVYARTDEVLTETGIDLEPEVPHRVVRMRYPEAGDQASYIEYLDTQVLLANLELARPNLWQVVLQHYLQRSGNVYDSVSTQNGAFSLKFRYPCSWYGHESSVAITHVLKVYDEPNRQVVVYRVMSEGEGALSGIATDETGWSVLRPSSRDVDRTLCRIVTRLTPMRFLRLAPPKAPSAPPPQLEEFTKMLFQFGDEDFQRMVKRLERLALEDSE